MTKKVLTVFGATGAQGGGLARAALAKASDRFAVRAVTRKPDSDKAQALKELGAEVVAADLDDPASVKRAMEGAHGAFCVTNFWEHASPERELAQARTLARASKEAGVQHVIWSTLEDTRKLVPVSDDRMPTLKEKYKVPHFDAKGEADQYFEKEGAPTTFLLTAFYWDNLLYFGMGPRRGEDGKLVFVLPMADKRLPGIAVEDIGKCALGVFERPDLSKKRVGIAGEHLTGEQMAQALSKAMGKEITYQYVPPEVYRTFDFPGADDIGNMFQYKRDFETEFCAARDLDLSRELNPELMTFEKWLEKYASKIQIQ